MKTAARPGGFTLLEVLVVVLIIGIILSFAVLKVSDRSRSETAQQEAERLAALLKLSSEEAVLQAREFALQLTAGGYEFLMLDKDAWKTLQDDGLLRPRRLPAEVTLSATIEGEATTPQDGRDQQPRIYLLSSGEMTAFTLDLRDAKSHYRLRGEPNGKLVLSEPEAAP
ncbi:MAG: type II secretion system minor pseudopilin GspH [Gammaproteobacteria bacterium]|nr:type II secretion system minor pseudopilin GspH [Gammaproteobacteria bacterium]